MYAAGAVRAAGGRVQPGDGHSAAGERRPAYAHDTDAGLCTPYYSGTCHRSTRPATRMRAAGMTWPALSPSLSPTRRPAGMSSQRPCPSGAGDRHGHPGTDARGQQQGAQIGDLMQFPPSALDPGAGVGNTTPTGAFFDPGYGETGGATGLPATPATSRHPATRRRHSNGWQPVLPGPRPEPGPPTRSPPTATRRTRKGTRKSPRQGSARRRTTSPRRRTSPGSPPPRDGGRAPRPAPASCTRKGCGSSKPPRSSTSPQGAPATNVLAGFPDYEDTDVDPGPNLETPDQGHGTHPGTMQEGVAQFTAGLGSSSGGGLPGVPPEGGNMARRRAAATRAPSRTA